MLLSLATVSLKTSVENGYERLSDLIKERYLHKSVSQHAKKEKMKNEKALQKPNSEILIYQTAGGQTKINVRFENENVWLTQKMMADLFQTTIPNINMHLQNIYEEGELQEFSTIKDFLIVQLEGNRQVERKQKFYSLDAIISVGYRIKSHIATKFRQWATDRLKEYIIKGFTMDSGTCHQ
jgi:hypothetical protein